MFHEHTKHDTNNPLGMNVAAGPKLAAAVTNAGSHARHTCTHTFLTFSPGGIGVIGGLRQNPKMLQQSIDEIKENLEDKNAPFGVDLLLPQVGGNARKTNVRLYQCLSLRYIGKSRLIDGFMLFASMITRMDNCLNSWTSSFETRLHSSSALSVSLQRRWLTNCTQPASLS